METDLSKVEDYFVEECGLAVKDEKAATVARASTVLDRKIGGVGARRYSGRADSQTTRADLAQILFEYHRDIDKIDKHFDSLEGAQKIQAKKFFGACNFDTKAFTKLLASELSAETGQEWLPIRYLLRAGTSVHKPREAYGVILAEALLCLPNMTDTMTLLNTGKFVPCVRYNIKYTEEKNCDKTEYEFVDVQNMKRIWELSSYNFLSIADTPVFNAILNLNETRDKPFLHLYLSKNSQRVLKSFGNIPTYRSYDLPILPEQHPRIIANKIIASQVAKNLSKNNEKINEK